MKHILFVHSVAEIGGAERMSHILMEGLNSEQFRPLLCCPAPGPFVELVSKSGFEVVFEPQIQPSIKSPIATFKSALSWRNLLRQHQIDIVHTADPYCTRTLLLGARLAGVEVVAHFHFPFEKRLLRWLFRSLPKPSFFAFCSQELQQSTGAPLLKLMPNVPQTTVHNGISIERFSPQTADNSVPKVGIIANLQKRKGHEDFIQMAQLIRKRGLMASFEIIGGDILEEPRQPLLEAMVADMELTEQVTFHGQVSDVLPLLGQLDLVVCASHQEAFPVSILEAMAMAKAIVATRVNGIPEAVDDGSTGLLVPAHDPQALSDAVTQLLEQSEKREEFGRKGRERVVSHFSTQHYVKGFEEIYNQLVAQ